MVGYIFFFVIYILTAGKAGPKWAQPSSSGLGPSIAFWNQPDITSMPQSTFKVGVCQGIQSMLLQCTAQVPCVFTIVFAPTVVRKVGDDLSIQNVRFLKICIFHKFSSKH